MLIGYGEKIEEDDIGLLEKAVGVKEGKVAVDGKFKFFSTFYF